MRAEKVLYYCLGGGLGHLSRAKVILDTYQVNDYRILTASHWATKIFPSSVCIQVPSSLEKDILGLREYLRKVLIDYTPDRIMIDTFPAGIMGELTKDLLGEIPLLWVCRRLKWQAYQPKLPNVPLFFEQALLMESLEQEHLDYLSVTSKEVLAFSWPKTLPVCTISLTDYLSESESQKPLWLLVHSTPQEEVEALADYAQEVALIEGIDPCFILITMEAVEMDGVKVVPYFPAIDFYPFADRIFTGAGFNSIQWAKVSGIKHHILPFERRYDDQFARKMEWGKWAE
ncbi:hypothetical protein [Algivirga pacifica]|uniref:UDP-N-acetylglucosamine:LPS N-acetylglucosamine transferase n=1 Tax=Algivirga pacifica TaxID=1162670 RepID=A0ABP9D9J5_9BACT